MQLMSLHHSISVYMLKQALGFAVLKHQQGQQNTSTHKRSSYQKWDALHNETTWYNVSKGTSADSHTLY